MSVQTSRLLLAGLAIALCSLGGASESAVPLCTSFENGTTEPAGWSLVLQPKSEAKGTWLCGTARTGARALEGQSPSVCRIWASTPMDVAPGKQFIADGFMKTESGAAWLETEYRDGQAKLLSSGRSPAVKPGIGWTYVATETALPAADARVTVQVFLVVDGGRAALDDVSVRMDSPVELVNAGFEAPLDQKGRVPYWGEEKDAQILPGKRGGQVTVQSGQALDGNQCEALTVSEAWIGAASVPYSVPAGLATLELTVMAKQEPGIQARAGVLWYDSDGKVLKPGLGPAASSPTWQSVSSGPQKPPTNAQTFKPFLLAERKVGATGPGSAWFDRVDMRVTRRPVVRVVVNQVGYEQRGPKRAIVMTNFFPGDHALGTAHLLRTGGQRSHPMTFSCTGRMVGQADADWAWYFWRVDFSDVDEPGAYRLEAEVGGKRATSHPFKIGSDVLFQETAAANVDFFFVQRCGFTVPGWHRACHLDDAKLPDGTHRDLTGGWHSAGDYNKLAWEYGDSGVFYALVQAAQAAPQYFASHDRDGDGVADALDEASWGAKYLAKIQDPTTGGMLNHIEQGPDRKTWMNWCPPELTTDNVVGTADDPIVKEGEGNAPLAIGAWARLSRLLAAQGESNDYLARSIRLWEHLAAKASADPLLLISSVDLYLATREQRYLDFCRTLAGGILASGDPDGALSGGYGNTGDVPAAALAHFALKLPDEPQAALVKARLAKHLSAFLAEAQNPLGLIKPKPGPDGFFFEPSSTLGGNYQICCRAWSAIMAYRVTGDRRALDYATDQLDFVLGRNPYDLCMLEGCGTRNPPRYHHRYGTIPGHERGAVPGTVPNGFVRDIIGRDRPGMDLSTGGRPYPSYRTNEPWLVHNVFYLLAVTALHEATE